MPERGQLMLRVHATWVAIVDWCSPSHACRVCYHLEVFDVRFSSEYLSKFQSQAMHGRLQLILDVYASSCACSEWTQLMISVAIFSSASLLFYHRLCLEECNLFCMSMFWAMIGSAAKHLLRNCQRFKILDGAVSDYQVYAPRTPSESINLSSLSITQSLRNRRNHTCVSLTRTYKAIWMI